MEQNPQPVAAKKLPPAAQAQVAVAPSPANVSHPPKINDAQSPAPAGELAANPAGYTTAPPVKSRSSVPMLKRASIKETLKKLDELDRAAPRIDGRS